MKPALLDPVRRHEADLALVHVPVMVRVEAGAAVEGELEQLVRRFAAALVRRLVAGRRILRRAQLAAGEEVHRHRRQAAARRLVLDHRLAAAHGFVTQVHLRARQRIFHMSGPVAGKRHDPVINRLVVRTVGRQRAEGKRGGSPRPGMCAGTWA